MVFQSPSWVHIPLSILLFSMPAMRASCPSTTPWSSPAQLSNAGGITSNIFSAANQTGFMAVWADSSNNAHYSFSADGLIWTTGLVDPAEGEVAAASDVFVGANASGFVATWIDGANDAWSSFSAWSNAIKINSSLALNSNADVFVAGGTGGFVATLIGADNNAYVSFSNGTSPWSALTQVTTDGSVFNQNWNSQTTRGFVSAVVVENSCMLAWVDVLYVTRSAYFDSINPFSATTVYPIVSVGFFESVPSLAALNGYFMATAKANQGPGQSYFSVATIPSNWATFSVFTDNPINPLAGSSVAANQTGFVASWIVADGEDIPGTPVWIESSNNGFNWTPVCSILQTPSTTIGGPVGISANTLGFVATWLDTNDSNAYAAFYAGPVMPVLNATGCKLENIFLSQISISDKLTWRAPASGTPPVSYRIYRDAQLTDLVATVPANGPLQYVVPGSGTIGIRTYYIVSVDASDNQSAPVAVTVAQNC